MRIGPGIRGFFFVVVLLAAGAASYLFYLSMQTETAYVFAKDLERYTFIENNGEDYLHRVSIPQYRDFQAITDPAQIVGMYVNQPVYGGQIVQGAMLISQLPDGRRLFPRGLLPENTEAFPIAVPNNVLPIFHEEDLVNIYAIITLDPSGLPSEDDIGVLLFQKVTNLGVADNQIIVALTPEQIMAFEGWQRLEGVRFTASISQEANWDYPPMQPFPLYPDYNTDTGRALFARPTPTPEPQQGPND
jgi:hypothetical protein